MCSAIIEWVFASQLHCVQVNYYYLVIYWLLKDIFYYFMKGLCAWTVEWLPTDSRLCFRSKVAWYDMNQFYNQYLQIRVSTEVCFEHCSFFFTAKLLLTHLKKEKKSAYRSLLSCCYLKLLQTQQKYSLLKCINKTSTDLTVYLNTFLL